MASTFYEGYFKEINEYVQALYPDALFCTDANYVTPEEIDLVSRLFYRF